MRSIKITNLSANGMCRDIRGSIDREMPTTIRDREGIRHTLTGKPIYWEGKPVVLKSFDDVYTMETPPATAPNTANARMFAEENAFYPLDRDRPSQEILAQERVATFEQSVQHANRKASKWNDRGRYMGMMMFTVMGVIVLMTIIFAIIAVSITFEKDDEPKETAHYGIANPSTDGRVIPAPHSLG